MRKDITLPVLAVAGGMVGFGLRRWQLASAYDPATHLFANGAPATYALLGLTALVGVLLVLLVKNVRGPEEFSTAFRCPATGYMAVMAAAAFLFFGTGVLGLMEGMTQLRLWRMDPEGAPVTYPAAVLLCGLLALAAGYAQLRLGQGSYRGKPAPMCSLLAVFPAFAGLVYLFATHLEHGTDPVLMGYGFSLAAAALLMLAHYYVAAFFHGRPHPRRTLICGLGGSFLGAVSLADGPSPFSTVLLAAFMLSALAFSWALLRNTAGPPWPKRLLEGRMPSGDGDEQPADEQPADELTN